MKHLYLESYSQREILKFFGIPENEANAEEGGEAFDKRAVLNQFLETVLGFQDPRRNIAIQPVHQVSKSNNGKPRPILACFLQFQDQKRILHQGFKLKGTKRNLSVGGKFAPHCNLDITKLPVMLPPFYQQCFDAWSDLTNKVQLSFQEIVNEIIWNNKFCCVDRKSVFKRDLFFHWPIENSRLTFG